MIFKYILILILVILSILLFIAYNLYNLGLNPHASKEGIFSSNGNKELRSEDTWLKENSNKKSIYINSFDNLKLHGYVVKNDNSKKWAICVHGYTNKCTHMSSIAYHYNQMGYNILTPDLRGHGKSQGDYIGMGWHDRIDMLRWIDHILKIDKDAEIILHGISMGASTVMMVSGEELPHNVKAIIEDCGYTDAKEQFSYRVKAMYRIPSFPILNICSLISKLKANYYIKEASAIEQVKKSKTPILFIHGNKDKFVPLYMLDKLYNACNSPKEKLIINDADHAKCERVNSDLYWSTVDRFINNYLN